jgi:SAM-dependent methyltransferase
MMSTDSAWEEWGRRDPYYGVITDPKFRRSAMTEQARQEFFESGQAHVDYVMRMIHRHFDASFEPKTILDFGCGVGRTLIPFAGLATQVLGLDISPSMLQEARRNCDERKLTNVSLALSDDSISSLTDHFDLIHSFIVFQHIAPARGKTIFTNLLAHLAPGAMAAVHFSYGKNRPESASANSDGAAPAPPMPFCPSLAPTSPLADPEMQMNSHPVNELLLVMQTHGVHDFHVQFTDHGGELGVFLFFAIA